MSPLAPSAQLSVAAPSVERSVSQRRCQFFSGAAALTLRLTTQPCRMAPASSSACINAAIAATHSSRSSALAASSRSDFEPALTTSRRAEPSLRAELPASRSSWPLTGASSFSCHVRRPPRWSTMKRRRQFLRPGAARTDCLWSQPALATPGCDASMCTVRQRSRSARDAAAAAAAAFSAVTCHSATGAGAAAEVSAVCGKEDMGGMGNGRLDARVGGVGASAATQGQ